MQFYNESTKDKSNYNGQNKNSHTSWIKAKSKLLSDVSTYRNEIYGASILWIMLFHGYDVGITWFAKGKLFSILAYGNMGVEIFLFLSGISLYFSYVKNQDAYAFFKRRIVRIVPSVYIMCVPYWIWVCKNFTGYDKWYFITNLSLMHFIFTGHKQIWFISCILLCYIFYPYIFRFLFGSKEISIYKSFFRMVLLVGILILLTYGFMNQAPTYVGYIEIALTRFPIFIIGCFMGKLVYEKKEISKSYFLLIVVSLIICFYVLYKGYLSGITSRYWYILGGIPITFIFAKLFSILPNVVRAPFRLMGNVSLELYVSHIIIRHCYQENLFPMKYVNGSIKRWIIIIIFSFILSVLVSYIVKVAKKQWTKHKTTIMN